MSVEHDRCITCGDVAVTGVVVDVEGDGATATVDVAGARERVAVDLVAPVSAGDRLLCHAGIALSRLDEAGAGA